MLWSGFYDHKISSLYVVLALSMWLFRDKDGTGNDGYQAPELVIGGGKSKGTMDELIKN
jgi:hypothetical protein